MKADKTKLQLAMARACMNISDVAKASGLPHPSAKNVLYGRSVQPRTIGKVAKALGVDVTEILEEA